jgi:hypothetical protein
MGASRGQLPWWSMIVLALLCLASTVWAHPISMSAVAVNVQEEQVLANMKIMLEDLVMYHGLQAGAEQRFASDDLKQAAAKHAHFVRHYFTIQNADGQPVPGEVLHIDSREIPDAGVPPTDLMARHIYYHLAFPLSQRQEFLTFTQTFGGNEAVLPAVMELVLFQNRVPLQRSTQLMQGKPYTVRFDWDNPPTAAPQNPAASHQRQEEESRRQLGITSYSGLYSFLYITHQEVRHEILIPLLTLEKWFPLARAEAGFIDVTEQEAAREHIVAFFRERNPVMIDGIAVKPALSRLQFFGLDINDFARDGAPRRLNAYQARVGLVLSYATKGSPSHVQLTWDTFNAFAPFLRSVVYIHDHDPQLHLFHKSTPHFTWSHTGEVTASALLPLPVPRRASMWSLPLVSIAAALGMLWWIGVIWRSQPTLSRLLEGIVLLLLLGGLCWPLGRLELRSPFAAMPQVEAEEARVLSASLLRNIYRAFDYKTESDIYDALAQSVDGQLLDGLYLQIHKGLQMQEQGGAIARVRAVELLDQQVLASRWYPDGQPQLQLQCRWRVTGTVEHWGHIHTRENEYQAALTVSARADTWKINAYKVLDEQRIRFETGLRTSKRSS